MYFANIYEWRALFKFYAAWVRRIEIDLSKWSDESTEIETPMLARFPLRGKVGFSMQVKKEGVKDQDSTWWCPDYNNSLVPLLRLLIRSTLRVSLEQSAIFAVLVTGPQSSSACPSYTK